MTDFSQLLNEKMRKAAAATKGTESVAPAAPSMGNSEGSLGDLAEGDRPPDRAPLVGEEAALRVPPTPDPAGNHPVGSASESAGSSGARAPRRKSKPAAREGLNTNRVTVNLFDADRRALAVIKEHLANAGHDFTNRSDSIKIGLRLAAKARKEELAALLLEIRAEDRRFSPRG